MLALLLAAAGRVGALDLDSILASSPYPPADRASIRSLFTEFHAMHIPAEILLPRLAEGAAKRIPLARIEAVLREDARFLEGARAALASAPGGSALIADQAAWALTATLLETGASVSDISALAIASRGESRPYRMGGVLYASLMAWGLSRERALKVTRSALRSSLPPEQLPGIVNLFEQGRRMAIPPDRLAGRLIDVLPSVRNIEDLRRAVLY